MAQQLKKNAKSVAEAGDDAAEVVAETEAALPTETTYQPPQVQQRQVVASRHRWPALAPLLASAAWALGFQGAAAGLRGRRFGQQLEVTTSFLRVVRGHPGFHPRLVLRVRGGPGGSAAGGRLGLLPALDYLGLARPGGPPVLAGERERQVELGLPEEAEAETSPRQGVSKTLTYRSNPQDKMKYHDYRRQGLPLTSSIMESTAKQINPRMKRKSMVRRKE